MQIDYEQVEETIKANYKEVTQQYRLDDEIEVTTENHRRLCATLRAICRSFNHPIRVLDVGCGTGRYFHCIENAECLVGLDVSDEMLKAARNPVRADQVAANRIHLIRGNAYLQQFKEAEFDFIYSLGMFGHGCPVTEQICERFHSWLKPSGKLLFNTVDFAGLPTCYRLRRRVKAAIYPFLPNHLKKRLDHREAKSPFFGMTARELRMTIQATRFRDISIVSHECKSPLWNGRHLECSARKDA